MLPMTIDANILQSLTTLEWPAVFWGSVIFGDTVILSAGYLAGQGVWNFWNVFSAALLGTMVADTAWFYFGAKGLEWTRRWHVVKGKHDALIAVIKKHTGSRPFLVLLVIKFLYGTRILTIIYLSMVKVRFLTFFFFDLVGTAVWLFAMVGVGWLAGKGIANVLPAVKGVEYVLGGLGALALVYKLMSSWVEKRINNRL